MDADILLIDEVLAVGDAAFQQKCFDVFHRMRDEGKTIVFVTHDMSALNRFCHRAMLLERGSIVELGEPQEVGDRYLEINFGRDDNARDADSGGEGGEARVVEVWVEDERGERLGAAPQGVRITLNGLVTFNVEVDDPQATLYVLDEDHRATVVASTTLDHQQTGRFRPGDEAVFSFTFDNVLAPGRYNPMFDACSARIWLGRHRSLRGFVLVRGHGRPATRRCRRSTGRRQRAAAWRAGSSIRRKRSAGERPGAGRTYVSSESIPYELLGPPIRGPRALTDSWSRFWHLTFNIARNEWKLRFFGSVLGYFWQLVRPLLLFGVLYVFFTVIAQVGVGQGPSGRYYGTQLLASIVLFTFFGGGDRRGGAVRRRQRGARSQDPVPTDGDPAVRGAAGEFQPRAEPGRRPDLRADPGRSPDAQLARVPSDRRDARRAHYGMRDAAGVVVRQLQGHAADLGGHRPGPVLREPGHRPVRNRCSRSCRRRRP